jgi:DNA-binding PadR family transcriptional regulator
MHSHHHDHERHHRHGEAHHYDDPGRTRVHDRPHRSERRGRRGRGFDRPLRGGFGPGAGGHRGGRRNRGDIRAGILALLAEEPMHGYQMIQELGSRSDGAWTPSQGSIYPALQMLQDEGLISAEETDGKRVFTLTASGQAAAAERGDQPAPWESAALGERGGFGDLRRLVMQVANAVHQVASAGSEEQIGKAVTLLTNTRRELYRILAEDDTDTAKK